MSGPHAACARTLTYEVNVDNLRRARELPGGTRDGCNGYVLAGTLDLVRRIHVGRTTSAPVTLEVRCRVP